MRRTAGAGIDTLVEEFFARQRHAGPVQVRRRTGRRSNVLEMTRKRHGLVGAGRALAGGPLPRAGHGAAVLCYHDVGTDPTNATDNYLSPDPRPANLEAVTSWGFTFVDFGGIADRLEAGTSLDGLIAVTFDDALVGVREHALPILTDLGIPSTVFVVTGVQGIDPPFWPGAAPTLDSDGLRALRAAGVQLASHTVSHASLPDIDDDSLRSELERSRIELEVMTGERCDLIAYPFGHQDARVRAAAADAGFRAACTFTFGRVLPMTDRFAIPRFCMGAQHHRARLAYQLARPAWAW
jgi:peptidoglycan/xylan/chitin deacetylase (PgdA/CDA1 family)